MHPESVVLQGREAARVRLETLVRKESPDRPAGVDLWETMAEMGMANRVAKVARAKKDFQGTTD